jgi:predicted DNA binding CopG/RHH family protein
MTKRINYTNEPLGEIEVIKDFLPPPSELAFREEGIKVTLALSKSSVDFFKLEASKHQTQYQRMIRRLLDSYVEAHAPTAVTGRSRRTAQKRAAA